MACVPAFSSLRRRKSPLSGAFYTPSDLTGPTLIQSLLTLASSVVLIPTPPFQSRNARALVRKIESFLFVFHFLRDHFPSSGLPPSATLCFRELYIVVFRSKLLLEYCSESSRLWLVLQNPLISGYFHDLTQEMSTLLDVFPIHHLGLKKDVRDQIRLIRNQSRRAKLFINPKDEDLRLRIYGFLGEFESGKVPEFAALKEAFVDLLGVGDAEACRAEIEFLEEQIHGQEEFDLPVLSSVFALARYCRFLLFGFEREIGDRCGVWKKEVTGLVGIGECSVAVPKEFCCPISLELMTDPVIVSTGQTYDRSSIARWIEEGSGTCPNSGQALTETWLVPNRALRSLISQWCAASGVAYDSPEASEPSGESTMAPGMSFAALEANKATVDLLVGQLSVGHDDAKAVAAHELRLLAKIGRENRAYIADAGAIPLLQKLFLSESPFSQENSVTAMLNLSILDKNKAQIMEVEGCLSSIVNVLRNGWTAEARENAAAALFSLSSVHDYKKIIGEEDNALEALSGLLREGSLRGKKDAIMALYNISTHGESGERMVESGAASALVEAVVVEAVAEEAAAALALLVRQWVAAMSVAADDNAIILLVGLIKHGRPRAKENALAALVEMCRSCGAAVTEKVASAPSMGGLIQTLLFSGTKRARRKAVSLARMFQRHDASGSLPFGGWALQYALARSRAARRGANFDSSDVSVSVPVSITVPVL